MASYAGMVKDRSQRAEGDGCCWKWRQVDAQCSKSEIGPSGEAGVGVNLEGLAGRLKIHEQCWRFAEAEEGSGTQKYLRIRRNTSLASRTIWSLEESGFVPSAMSDSAGSRERLRVKYMCDEKCDKEGYKFFHVGGRRRQAAHD